MFGAPDVILSEAKNPAFCLGFAAVMVTRPTRQQAMCSKRLFGRSACPP